MKKYVLNIDRLYSGQTANALVLDQVDEDFPVLVPAQTSLSGFSDFKTKWHAVYPKFNPSSTLTLQKLNEYIVDFNLDLQAEFKQRGH